MQIRFTFKHVNLAASLLVLSLSVGQTQTANAQTSDTSTPNRERSYRPTDDS